MNRHRMGNISHIHSHSLLSGLKGRFDAKDKENNVCERDMTVVREMEYPYSLILVETPLILIGLDHLSTLSQHES